MHFADRRENAIPMFGSVNILPPEIQYNTIQYKFISISQRGFSILIYKSLKLRNTGKKP